MTFAIPGSGVQTIAVATALPAITESVAVDGYTQPGSVPNSNPYFTNAVLRIELQGSGTDGLTVTGGATSIRGLAMHGFQNAIAVTSALGGNLIAGNFLGTDAAGAPTSGNTNGVSITGTSGDIVGGEAPADKNLISGNTIGVLAHEHEVSACRRQPHRNDGLGLRRDRERNRGSAGRLHQRLRSATPVRDGGRATSSRETSATGSRR